MTPENASSAFRPVSSEIHYLLREYLSSSKLAEIVYRDAAGQIQTTHDVIRNLFSRAGQEFVFLGRGHMVRVDHLLTLDGKAVASTN